MLGLDHSRESLIYTGNKLREHGGPSVLAKRVIEKILKEKPGKAIIDSIRNLSEIKELRKLPGLLLLGIDAPVELRFERARSRGRVGFEKTLKEFIDVEKKENSSDPLKQQLFECLKQSDKIIINNGTIDDLRKKVEEILK